MPSKDNSTHSLRAKGEPASRLQKAQLPPTANGSKPPPTAQLSEEDKHICLDILSVIIHGDEPIDKKGSKNEKIIKEHEDVYNAARRVLRFRELSEDDSSIERVVTNVNLHPELDKMVRENQVYGDAKKKDLKTAEEHAEDIQIAWTRGFSNS